MFEFFALLTVLLSFLLLVGKLAILIVAWYLIKDIVQTVSSWIRNVIGSINATSIPRKILNNLISDAKSTSKSAKKTAEYDKLSQILNNNSPNCIVLVQNELGDIVGVSGIKAKKYQTDISIEEDPDQNIIKVTPTGRYKKIPV